MNNSTTLIAVPVGDGLHQHVKIDGRGDEALYRAACELAAAVGIDLLDG